MPFNLKTKTRMFIRCSRLCCLCLKQCGTNIEAAHIVDEHAGGSNEEENGIPVCFDCHQEVGAYDLKHPKGNKFTPEELKSRRDRIYSFVESGAIYAQIVAQQIRSTTFGDRLAEIPPDIPNPTPSSEGKRFFDLLLSQGSSAEAPARKLKLLSPSDSAYIIDRLLSDSEQSETAVQAIGLLLSEGAFLEDSRRVVLEALVRRITLFGSLSIKIALLDSVPEETLSEVSVDLRATLFADLLGIVAQDQYDQVNKLVPVLVNHVKDIPQELYAYYVITILDQSWSAAFKGAPAAARALMQLPDEVVRESLQRVNPEYLWYHGTKRQVKEFVKRYQHLASPDRQELFEDLIQLSRQEFSKKYDPLDE